MVIALTDLRRVNEAAALTFAQVYQDHVQDVARWASRLGGPQIEVEDVVQETFAIVQKQLPGYRPEARLTTWLFRITENAVRHQQRNARWHHHWPADPRLEPGLPYEPARGRVR